MDLNCNISSLDFSLKTICAIRLVRHLLMVCDRTLGRVKDSRKIETEVSERVKKSDWPWRTKQQVENFIKPINRQIDLFRLGLNPIFTPQGTVNGIESTKAVLEDVKTDTCIRFLAACTLCNLERMIELAVQLNEGDICRTCCRLSFDQMLQRQYFIQSTCRVRSLLKQIGEDRGNGEHRQILLQLVYDVNLKTAVLCCLDPAVSCYLEKGAIGNLLSNLPTVKFNDERRPLSGRSPATHQALISKKIAFDPLQGITWCCYAEYLEALLTWPYQHLFLKASRSLVHLLNAMGCWRILSVIAHYMADGFKDYDYFQLFVAFWKLSMTHAEDFTIGIRNSDGLWTAYYAFYADDELLSDFLLREISEKDKETLLFGFIKKRFFPLYFIDKKSQSVERMIRGCGAGKPSLLARFKDEFTKLCLKQNCNDAFESKWKSTCDWEADLHHLTDIVNDTLAMALNPSGGDEPTRC